MLVTSRPPSPLAPLLFVVYFWQMSGLSDTDVGLLMLVTSPPLPPPPSPDFLTVMLSYLCSLHLAFPLLPPCLFVMYFRQMSGPFDIDVELLMLVTFSHPFSSPSSLSSLSVLYFRQMSRLFDSDVVLPMLVTFCPPPPPPPPPHTHTHTSILSFCCAL